MNVKPLRQVGVVKTEFELEDGSAETHRKKKEVEQRGKCSSI